MLISIKGLKKNYSGKPVFDDLDIQFESNQITCLLGPSGCGKTTLLNYISGLVEADSGKIEGFDAKSISYLFQEPRLLPWKTVFGNVAFVLKGKYEKTILNQVVESYLEMVGLTEYRDYYPSHLSGGMRQRVAIARAFAYPSEILLMDEPFKGLDPKLKSDLMKSFLELWVKDKRTVVFVTHDVDEAVMLGHFVYIMSKSPAQIIRIFEINTSIQDRFLKSGEMAIFKEQINRAFDL